MPALLYGTVLAIMTQSEPLRFVAVGPGVLLGAHYVKVGSCQRPGRDHERDTGS